MTVQRSEGITTSLFAVTEPEEDAPEQPDEDHDEIIEAGSHPARPAVSFQHHRQEGNREHVRGLPPNLKTSPLGPGRSGRRSK